MEAFLILMIVAATPLILAGIGELIAERSGVLNLGVEGMMLMGAVTAFGVSMATGSSALGVFAGGIAGGLMALIFSVLTLSLLTNQAATGLALTIFGIGASGLIGQDLVGQALEPLAKLSIPVLSETTMAGRLLLSHDALVYFAIAIAIAAIFFLSRTRAGLSLRAVGDSPTSAHALGIRVIPIRYVATMFGGFLAGLGGAHLSLARTPFWAENMTAGSGWIALALVVFATWRPARLIAGAFLFSAVTILQFYTGALDAKICGALPFLCAGPNQDSFLTLVPSQFWSMAPYVITVAALVIISRDVTLTKANAPASIGQPFRADR